MVLGLLTAAATSLSGGGGVLSPPTPDVTTVSPTINAINSAPFAVGRGARASAPQPSVNPRDPIVDFNQAGGGTGALAIGAVVLGAFILSRRR